MAYRTPNLTCPPECNVDLPCGRAFANRIAAIDDLQRLKQLHRAAIQVQVSSLEAFEQALDA